MLNKDGSYEFRGFTISPTMVEDIRTYIDHGVDPGNFRDAGEIAKVAAWLRGLDQPARDVIAAEAGARSPSEETWSEVVRSAEQRRSVSEMFPVSRPPRLTVLAGGRT